MEVPPERAPDEPTPIEEWVRPERATHGESSGREDEAKTAANEPNRSSGAIEDGLDEFGRLLQDASDDRNGLETSADKSREERPPDLKRSRTPDRNHADAADEPPRKRFKPSPDPPDWSDSKSNDQEEAEEEGSDSSKSDDDLTGREYAHAGMDENQRQEQGKAKLQELDHGPAIEDVFNHKRPGQRKPWEPFGIAAKPCILAVWKRLMKESNDFEGWKGHELKYWKYIEAITDRSCMYVLYVVKYLFEVKRNKSKELNYLDGSDDDEFGERGIPPEELEWQYQIINCVVNYGDERGWGWSQPKNVFVSKFVAEFDPELIIYTMKKIREYNPDTFDKLAAHYIDKIVDDSDSFLKFIVELTEEAPSVVEVGQLIMQAYKGPQGVFEYFQRHYFAAEETGEIGLMYDLIEEAEEGGPQPGEDDECQAVSQFGQDGSEPTWKDAIVHQVDDDGALPLYKVDFVRGVWPDDQDDERFYIMRRGEHVKWRDDRPAYVQRCRWDELEFPSIFLWRVARAKNMSKDERTKFVAFLTREWSSGEEKGYVNLVKEILDVENEDFTAIVPVGVMYKPVDVDFDKQGVCC